ncbi:(2Fe-2S) ferredoxin domain-containing protein [Streptomyces buecherae]|uniref:(2Fe-2S) ferredoxin domain-containing protein n=1 Tax=Streptomyces buecherae TaxID=2763006 RepID=UPI001E41B1F2|nr:(2Fe-2S) ferredoxin domain-containing protein [Streptomyces buecherae]
MISNADRRAFEARRAASRAPRAAAAACKVTVCRGCCCGDARKVPGVDHAGQIARLREAVGTSAAVRASDCLDVCDQANVMVVQPSPQGRAAGGRPVWLGLVNDDDALADIASWLRAGGPGIAEPPGVLDLYAFTVSRRVREALED